MAVCVRRLKRMWVCICDGNMFTCVRQLSKARVRNIGVRIRVSIGERRGERERKERRRSSGRRREKRI